MRLREPVFAGELVEEANKLSLDFSESRRPYIKYRVTVITPIYGGGVQSGIPDEDGLPIRETSINYQLRFWWRLLKLEELKHTGGENLYERLYAQERELWGALAEGNNDCRSKVTIKILRPLPRVTLEPCQRLEVRNGKIKTMWTCGIPAYALFPGQGKLPHKSQWDLNNPKWEKKPALVISTINCTFDFGIGYREEIMETQIKEVEQAMRAWANFGGIGARTRRGMGSVRVEQLEQGPAKLLSMDSPGHAKEFAAQFGCTLEIRDESAVNTVKAAWNEAVEALWRFRQGIDLGRKAGPGRSHWPEPDTLRDIVGHYWVDHKDPERRNHAPKHGARKAFPRAVFGLPIIFDFLNRGASKDDIQKNRYRNKDPKKLMLNPEGAERMASPFILKAMAWQDEEYVPIALLLPTHHLRKLNLRLQQVPRIVRCYPLAPPNEKNFKSLEATCTETERWWPVGAAEQKAKAKYIEPIKRYLDRGGTVTEGPPILPLLAFLDYFRDPKKYEPPRHNGSSQQASSDSKMENVPEKKRSSPSTHKPFAGLRDVLDQKGGKTPKN